MKPKFQIGQQVKTTKAQEYDNGIEDCGYLPKGSMGEVIGYDDDTFCYVDFGENGTWLVDENELEAMESE